MNILETKDLKHSFGPLKVLFGVDLQIAEGERHAVIGPNGAGKTTLFNTITGTYTPDQRQGVFQGKGHYRFWAAQAGADRHRALVSDYQHLYESDGVSEHPPGDIWRKKGSASICFDAWIRCGK